MYNIIPLILILISLSIIIFIVVRRFPVLASMDVDNIQEEKEAKFKEQIISNRLKRNIIKWSSRLSKIFGILGGKASILFKWIYNKLYELKDNYSAEEILADNEKQEKIKELFSEAKELIEKDNLKEAEKKVIDIIGIDSKNLAAFKSLGSIYFNNKNYGEAKQTFEHILKLMEDNEDLTEIAEIHFNLSLVNRALNNLDEALGNIKRALEIEPNNPRYLDTRLETSIMNKDKILALNTYDKLKESNPENKKLKDFKRQIDEL